MYDNLKTKILVSLSLAFERYGGMVGRLLVRNFEKKTGLAPSEILERPEEFVSCIYEIFGAGAKSIEDTIVEEICREFSIDASKVSGLVDALHLASKKIPSYPVQNLNLVQVNHN
ncbi:MAG: hypothetical protein OK439_06750 [Thaumarchaeota archaeon]|nr:hypothetical protein [Nitrososphaerota archaeon]